MAEWRTLEFHPFPENQKISGERPLTRGLEKSLKLLAKP
jgi:hypothetical protein